MEFRPSRRAGFALDLLGVLLLLPGVIYAIIQLSSAALSVWTVLWVMILLSGVPLILSLAYNLYGLMTARFATDRDGFYLRWGWSFEQIPIKDILSLRLLDPQDADASPSGWLRWPATTTRTVQGDQGLIEYFLSAGRTARVRIDTEERVFIISPANPEQFHDAYREASLLGALQPIEQISQRPRFALTHLVADRGGLAVLSLGLILPIILLGYLALRVPDLPSEVAFGFDADGFPQTFAPPGRLLLLPLASGLCWTVNLLLGLWLYRTQANRPLAYALWAASIVVSGLFWGATLQLLAV